MVQEVMDLQIALQQQELEEGDLAETMLGEMLTSTAVVMVEVVLKVEAAKREQSELFGEQVVSSLQQIQEMFNHDYSH